MAKQKKRLDVLMVEKGLVRSRERAKRLIMAGEVTINQQMIIKPAVRIAVDADIQIKQRPPFVSRGGLKLAEALDRFQLNPAGWVCADVGASTGGFTDCLLQAGASRVYAIDAGYGQLAWPLRNDERVIVMERTNARHLDSLPELIDFATADVSFISLRLILPSIKNWLQPGGQVVVLVKPQFEAGRSDVGKGGVVRDVTVHRRVLETVTDNAMALSFSVLGLVSSPIHGPSGNIEFLLWLTTDDGLTTHQIEDLIESALQEAHPVDEDAASTA